MKKRFPFPFVLSVILAIVMTVFLLASCASKTTVKDEEAEVKYDMNLKTEAPAREMSKQAEMRQAPPPSAAMTGAPLSKAEAKPQDATPVTTWKRAQAAANASRLMIGDKEELPLKGMQINVLVEGFRARVIIDTYYFNNHNRQYEGTFKLRLPEGANPYFFAFGEMVMTADVNLASPIFMQQADALKVGATPEEIMAARKDSWTAPREARMVPKEKAAYAYTETVRRRIDPALMEWSGSGIFSSRVFPLLPQKLHRIVIGYEVDLTPAGNDLEYRLDLPPDLPQSIVDISVSGNPDMKAELIPAADWSRTDGAQKGTVKLYHRFANPKEQGITVRLKDPGATLLTGTDKRIGDFFAASLQPQLPANPSAASSRPAVFVVDVSLSSNPDQFNIYLKLLEAILKNNRKELKQFAVMFFNIETFWWRESFSENTDANVAALLKFANKLSLEGATDIGAALRQAAKPSWMQRNQKPRPWDVFLLSDGAATWGESDLYAISQGIKGGSVNALYAYRTGYEGADLQALHHLTRESGGAVFTVVGEAEIKAASRAHAARPWLIEDVRMDGCTDLLLAGRPRSIYPGQPLFLAGRGKPAPGAKATFRLRQGDQTKNLSVAFRNSLSSVLAVRAYGLIAVGHLEAFGYAAEDKAKAYATHFRVTGKTDSLLMLESEADYLRFNIKPEEDAFVIKSCPVGDTIAGILRDIGQSLGDPKAAFMAWLNKMEKQPGVSFETPASLKLALQQIPAKSFSVRAETLHAKHRTWKDIPDNVRQQITSKSVEYDPMTAEAERRYKDYGPSDALRALSSLVENNPGDGVLARDVSYSAINWKLPGHAFHIFRRVAESRPYEPQTYRDMAGVLASIGMVDLALVYYEVGLTGKWDSRFGEFRRIHGLDYLRFLRQIESGKLKTSVPDYAKARLGTIAAEFDPGKVDLLVSITWNTDNTDVDLHVLEPSGEDCYYGHRKTRIGGYLTTDVTRGFGPEMYILPKAPSGTYNIRVKYFASDTNRKSARTKVSATVIEGWGSKHEKITRRTATLKLGQEMHDIMKVSIGGQDVQIY